MCLNGDWNIKSPIIYKTRLLESFLLLSEKDFVNMWDHATTWDGSFDETVKFFITSDSELEMSWSNSSDFEIFWGVSSQFKNLSS
mgnify:CR=1 FL=1